MTNDSLALRFVLLAAVLIPRALPASDPPHDFQDDCGSCHITHGAAAGQLTAIAGNANLCLSCHTSGGIASGKPFVSGDQAVAWPGLPAGAVASGTSHRWDAGSCGHAAFLGGAAVPSTGQVYPAGAFTGVYAKTYTITVTASGNAGAALYSWTATTPGGGAGTDILTSTNAPLDEGAFLSFVDGSNVSFQAGDRWILQVRPDLRATTNAVILLHATNGVAYCSACHDQHLQQRVPFDPSAPAYGGTSNVTGRHFMRIDNDQHQLCNDCHGARVVAAASAGSHPVGVSVPSNSYYRVPAALPLEKNTGRIGCLTCHKAHYAAAGNGALLRVTNTVAICTDCHRLADTNTPAAHLSLTNGLTLWPGGQYGSLMPARTNSADRGSCLNCHAAHGWPDAASPTNDYPVLLADREENLCFTCHDTDGPAAMRVKSDFDKVRRHPVANSDPLRRPGRSVECNDCHHVHDALAGSHVYTNTATSTRNRVSNPLKGVSGVAFSYSGLTNFQVVAASRLSAIAESSGGATNEYEVCLKCHSVSAYAASGAGTASFTNGSAVVSGSGTAWSSSLVGLWIACTNDGTYYAITNVSSATSLRISSAYGGATASGRAYQVLDFPAGITPVYSAGTANFTSNSAAVTGSGTAWHAGLTGAWVYRTNAPAAVYRVASVLNATNLLLSSVYTGATASAQAYAMSVGTDLAQEFSPMNRSGHPVVTGLSNYSNSPAPRALIAGQMVAPWAGNLGTQTMMCSDCHNTDAASPAAQGPHGSAVQFMLRGANANNWPDVTLANYSSSWCANCHTKGTTLPHTQSNHNNTQCYRCHIVIPHGGKVSRLVGDRDSMPARYAYSNDVTTMYVQSFLKYSPGNYQKDSCRASCTSEHSSGGSENW